MKTMKTKKRVLLICIFVIAIFAVLALTISADEVETDNEASSTSLSIDYCNLSFRSQVCIKYAVMAENAADVSLLIWNEAQDNYLAGTEAFKITEYYTETIDGSTYLVFDYCELSAKQMTDTVFARAYTTVDGAEYYSDLHKYSILQYAYSKLGKTDTASTNEELKAMLTAMLSYGASAQKYFSYNTERLATDDFYMITVSGGTLSDKTTSGLYLEGDEILALAPEVDQSGALFSHWENESGAVIATAPESLIIVGNKNQSYTAVYIKYSDGLEFTDNGDGTCTLTGIGTCADSYLVIPEKSDTGATVVAIGASALASAPITSIRIPLTVKEVAEGAFEGCSALADVHYNGTYAEWESITVADGNDPLANAVKHFSNVYTVAYDTDGASRIASESVNTDSIPTRPADPQRAGYVFGGWYLDAACETPYDFDYALNANVTLYAKMTAEYIFISTAEELDAIANDTTAKYMLTNDINYMGLWTPITEFSGILDGNGYKIYNLNLIETSARSGFIRTNSGVIKNLSFEECTLTYVLSCTSSLEAQSGFVTGVNGAGGIIENCKILNSSVSFTNNLSYNIKNPQTLISLGGFVGYNSGTISGCVFDSDMTISSTVTHAGLAVGTAKNWVYSGMIAGKSYGTVRNSSASGSIITSTSTKSTGTLGTSAHANLYHRNAGLVGVNSGTVENCFTNVSISNSATNTSGDKTLMWVGSLVSHNAGIISDCYSMGSLSTSGKCTEELTGGLVSYGEVGKIIRCYSTVTISSDATADDTKHVGGIVGLNAGTVTNGYYDGTVSITNGATAYCYTAAGAINCYVSDISSITLNGSVVDPGENKVTTDELYSYDFIKGSVFFDPEIWSIKEGEQPTLKCFE